MSRKRPANAAIQERHASGSNSSIMGPAGYEFVFKMKKDPEYQGDLMVVTGKAKLHGREAGTLEAKLVCRPSRNNFMEVCDESQELCDLAADFCDANGFVRRDIDGLQSTTARERASRGGFLQIEMVNLDEIHRRKDVGISFLEALLTWLDGKWSLCVLQSGVARDPYEDNPSVLEMKMRIGAIPSHLLAATAASVEKGRKRVAEASKKIARQWLRLGFRQKRTQSDLFYLVPEHLTKIAKADIGEASLASRPQNRQPPCQADQELLDLISNTSADNVMVFQANTQRLMARGASIDRCNAMHYAAANGKLQALLTLNRLGGNVNHKDADNNTPLHVAASMPTLPFDTINLLLRIGASVTDVDQEGRRPAKMLLDSCHGLVNMRAAFQLSARPMDRDQDKVGALFSLLTGQECSVLQGKGIRQDSPLSHVMPAVEQLLFDWGAA